MPTVPMAEQRVAQRPLADRRAFTGASADSFGAIQGRQFEQLGQSAERAGDPLAVAAARMAQRQDDEQVRRAFLDFDKRTRDYLLNPDTGVYNRRGANAQGASTEAFKTLDEYEVEVSNNLANDRQRTVFAQRAASIKSGHLDGIARHESNEFKRVEEETTQAFLQSSIEGATTAYADPKLREQYRAQGEFELNKLADTHGWTPEMRELKKHEYTTLMHKSVIERMLVDDPTGARAYYDQNATEIDGATGTQIEKALKVGVTRENAYREVERILGEHDSYTGQLAAARALGDKALADEVVQRVKERHAEREQMRAEGERYAKDAAWQAVMSSGSLAGIPPHVMAQLDGYTVTAMQNYVDKQGAIDTDPATYAELSRMSFEDPKRFAGLNMLDYMDKLDKSTWQSMQGLQRSVAGSLAGDTAAERKTVKEATIQQQINSALDAAGILGDDDTGKTRRGKFAIQARSALDAAEQQKGSALGNDEVDKVLGRLLLEGQRARNFMPDASTRFFDVAGTEDEAKFYVPFKDIPEAERTKIADKLKARGKTASEEAIAAVYLKAQLNAR